MQNNVSRKDLPGFEDGVPLIRAVLANEERATVAVEAGRAMLAKIIHQQSPGAPAPDPMKVVKIYRVPPSHLDEALAQLPTRNFISPQRLLDRKVWRRLVLGGHQHARHESTRFWLMPSSQRQGAPVLPNPKHDYFRGFIPITDGDIPGQGPPGTAGLHSTRPTCTTVVIAAHKHQDGKHGVACCMVIKWLVQPPNKQAKEDECRPLVGMIESIFVDQPLKNRHNELLATQRGPCEGHFEHCPYCNVRRALVHLCSLMRSWQQDDIIAPTHIIALAANEDAHAYASNGIRAVRACALTHNHSDHAFAMVYASSLENQYGSPIHSSPCLAAFDAQHGCSQLTRYSSTKGDELMFERYADVVVHLTACLGWQVDWKRIDLTAALARTLPHRDRLPQYAMRTGLVVHSRTAAGRGNLATHSPAFP